MLCTTTMTIYMGLQSISAFTLVGVAVTRFISIRNPLKFQTIVTRARVINVLFITWTGLFLLSGALYFRTTSSKKYSRMCRYEFVQRVSDMMATSVTSVFLPLIVMAVLYGFMLIEAKKHVIAMAQSRGSTGGHSGVRRYIIRKELRMVVMTGLLLGYFALAWIPFVVYEFYAINRCSSEIDRDKCEPDRYVRATVRLILHSNSAINFFIYAVRMRDFQAAFRSDLRRLLSASRCSRTPSLIGENVCSARLAKLYPETDIELRASGDTSSQSGNDVTPIHVRPEIIGEASPQQLVTTL